MSEIERYEKFVQDLFSHETDSELVDYYTHNPEAAKRDARELVDMQVAT